MKIEEPGFDCALKPAGVEVMSLEDLARLGEQRFSKEDVLGRARRSSLYRRRFKTRDVERLGNGRREDLRRLPFTDRRHLRDAQKGRRMRSLACAPVWMWFASSGTGAERIWIPYGRADILRIMGLLSRLSDVCEIERGDRVLAIPPMAPRISNALPYLWMYADMYSIGRKLEFITGSVYMLDRSDWPEFALRRQPTVLLAQPDDAAALSEYYVRTASAPPGELLPGMKRGVFLGPLPRARRQALEGAYRLEAFTCILSVEFPGLFAECRAHDGCHVWMDMCIPELIPIRKTGSGSKDYGCFADTVFLDQAEPGMEGELVVTTFGEALPLVRFRTGDFIRVMSVSPCSCGITHPRIEYLESHS